ncbi:MAG: hypothetical protein ACE5JH_05050 [Acidobacteriota bacterium]
MRPRRMVAGMVVALVICSVGPALATMVRSASLEETIDGSHAIIVGRVLGQRAFRSEDGRIMTGVTIRVEESLKGGLRPGARIEISAYGGELGGQRLVSLGEATYRRGERVLLQLERIDGRLHTIGLSMGKWTVTEDRWGRRHVTRDLSGLGLVGGVEMTQGPIPLDEFRRLVEERARGR